MSSDKAEYGWDIGFMHPIHLFSDDTRLKCDRQYEKVSDLGL
ncbi:hypothetical protein ACQ4M3_12170 [Leptolyngbya sp. AN03gr2]